MREKIVEVIPHSEHELSVEFKRRMVIVGFGHDIPFISPSAFGADQECLANVRVRKIFRVELCRPINSDGLRALDRRHPAVLPAVIGDLRMFLREQSLRPFQGRLLRRAKRNLEEIISLRD